MDRNIRRIVLQSLPLIIPLNIYIIGDWLAAGLQWALFKYQVPFAIANASPFFITLIRDIQYITLGIIGGRSAVAYLIWCAASVLLVCMLALVLYSCSAGCDVRCRTYVPHVTILAGCLYIVSCMLQFGIALHGESGFTIPIGVPAVIIIGYWTYRMDQEHVAAEPAVPAPEED